MKYLKLFLVKTCLLDTEQEVESYIKCSSSSILSSSQMKARLTGPQIGSRGDGAAVALPTIRDSSPKVGLLLHSTSGSATVITNLHQRCHGPYP